jgi:hypothetical protein
MIQNYDKISKWNTKSTQFEIFIFSQQWLTPNIWSIGVTINIFNNKLQKISLKNSFIWKSENTKRTHNPFVGSFLCICICKLE